VITTKNISPAEPSDFFSRISSLVSIPKYAGYFIITRLWRNYNESKGAKWTISKNEVAGFSSIHYNPGAPIEPKVITLAAQKSLVAHQKTKDPSLSQGLVNSQETGFSQ
jgi:hypothetical protein